MVFGVFGWLRRNGWVYALYLCHEALEGWHQLHHAHTTTRGSELQDASRSAGLVPFVEVPHIRSPTRSLYVACACVCGMILL